MKNEGGFWIPMAVGAGVGLLKNQADKERADRMNQAAAVQTAHSPHSGLGAGQMTQAPSGLESAMQGGMAGAQMGQAYGDYQNQQTQADYWKKMAGMQA